MRLLAASFQDGASARDARARLLSELVLDADQVGVEALAQPGDRAGAAAILAGRFQEDVVAAAREMVEGLGGTVMLDIDAAETNA